MSDERKRRKARSLCTLPMEVRGNQEGSLHLYKGKKKSSWSFRWSEYKEGKRITHGCVIGTTRDFPTYEEARAAADYIMQQARLGVSIPELIRRKHSGHANKSVPNFTIDWFTKATIEQQGRCAICGLPSHKLVVDHDHETGKLRGLLCRQCNSGIGMLKDDMFTIRKALLYLEEHAHLNHPKSSITPTESSELCESNESQGEQNKQYQ
jgi:hypothetical protein